MGKRNTKGSKRILIVCIAVALVAVAVAGLLLLRPNTEDSYRTIVAAQVSGTVLVSNDKKQDVPAYEGMALYDGDRISVGENASLTVELDGDKYMMAEAGTKFRLEATGKAGSEKTVIHLESGAALTRIKNALNEDQSYVVETPNSVISVRGTVWRTSYSENAQSGPITLCQVFGGLVEMAVAGDSRQIPGGSSACVIEGQSSIGLEALDYSKLPKGIIEILLSFIDDREELDATREELESYLHEHTWSAWEAEGDNHIRACECEETQNEPHNWNEGEITTQPTHLAEGVKTFTCGDCGYTKTEPVEKLSEHTWGQWKAEGDNHIRSCECEETQSEPHNWNEGEIAIQPTHLAEGVKTFTCGDCGRTKTEPVEKLSEHTWGKWEAEGDNHIRSCECEETQSEPHNWNEGEITTQPTHLAEGVKSLTCADCGHTKTEAVEKLTNHTWGQWKAEGDNHIRSCECEETQSEPHNWNEGEITTQPTHLAEGVKTFTCGDCGYTKTEAVEKLSEHTWGQWKAEGDNHIRSCECGETQTELHSFGEGVEGTDPTGAAAMVFACIACHYEKYEIIQNTELTEFDGQFAVDGVGYETWYEAALALSNSSSRTVWLLRDLMYDVFSYVYGAITLPYDNSETLGTAVPDFYEMTWDLNGCGVSLFSASNSTDIIPPRIREGAVWTIRATGGGMLKTEGKGLYLPWYGGVLEGKIIILGGMFDFDPAEYVPEGYTVKMVLSPQFYLGEYGDEVVDYATILAKYGTYSAIINDRDTDEDERYRCGTPGLWIVYPDGQAPTGCDHGCFTYLNTVYTADDSEGVDYNYCSGCGQLVDHRHSAYWLKNPDEHAQECATCYEILVDWDVHTFDEGKPGVNEFGENATIYTCTACGFRDVRVTCTGEHIYGTGTQGTASWGATVMLYSCIYCDHQVTFDTLHECEVDWDAPVYNSNYHWYACTTTGCPARIDYDVHSYERGCGITDAPTHDTPGITVTGCYCGHWLPGSEVRVEFYDYFLDFSGCTTEGINYYDNTIYAGDAFDYENIKLVGGYYDTTFEYDDNDNIISYDYGRVLDASEYTIRIYRVYSWDQKLLLSTLDRTVPGEYEIDYVTPDGYYYTVSLTILARPTDGYTWLTVKPEGATDGSTAKKITYALTNSDGEVGEQFTAGVDGEGMTNTELYNTDLGIIQQLQIQVVRYDPTGQGFYVNFTVMEGYDVWVFTQDESGNGYLGYAGSSYWFDDTVKYIVVLHSDYTMDEDFRLQLADRLSGYGSGSVFSDPNEGFLIQVIME